MQLAKIQLVNCKTASEEMIANQTIANHFFLQFCSRLSWMFAKLEGPVVQGSDEVRE